NRISALGDVHGETVTAMQDATHAPWSNSGVTHPTRGRTVGIALGAVAVVGVLAAWLLSGGSEEPTSEVTSGSTLAAPPPPNVVTEPEPQPKPEPKPTTADVATSKPAETTSVGAETKTPSAASTASLA